MFNLTKQRRVWTLGKKAPCGVLLAILLAPAMLVSAQQTTGSLRRFYSKELKVGFRYPAGWKFELGDGLVGGDNFRRLAKVTVPEKSYPRTNFTDATASLVAGSVSEAACREFQPDVPPAKPRKIQIGNLAFYVVSVEEGAAGTFYRRRIYRTFHDAKCYEVSLDLQTANMAAYDPGTVKAVNDKMVFNLMETVVRTLYFGK